jgi:hypothetical protein
VRVRTERRLAVVKGHTKTDIFLSEIKEKEFERLTELLAILDC